MSEYFNLGTYQREISTPQAEAKLWFNRGLNWCYAFHHSEAVRCFQKVIDIDPYCALGYWGLAYATGPYYNVPWLKMSPTARPLAVKTCYENAQKALALATSKAIFDVEIALCEALAQRFQSATETDEEVLARWDDAYADAMRLVYSKYPDDYDVAALTAEAFMVRTPWNLWDLEQRTPTDGADTLEAINIIEKAFEKIQKNSDEEHPGLLHFYIHIMELSPHPERALVASDKLRPLVPDAGHLIHMPSHIYVLCGQYDKVISSNIEATHADKKYLDYNSEIGIYYLYYLHNVHFQIYGAFFSGQYELAINAANQIQKFIKPEFLETDHDFLINYFEYFYSMKYHVLVRFGKWQEILDEKMAYDPNVFCVSNAVLEYSKGIAHAVLGNISEARDQKAKLQNAFAAIPAERIIFQNDAHDIIGVAMEMLDGETEYKCGHYTTAFKHLRTAVRKYDTLNYAEPWSWMMPPRHALGALLLDQGQVAEAKEVYRADLGLDDTLVRPSQHPGNIWSLLGYQECCERTDDASGLDEIAAVLEAAKKVADPLISTSCFCRTTSPCCD